MAAGADAPHLPRPAPIEAYGDGGFRFGGMSHRGSLLCFPDGIWAWPVKRVAELNADNLRAALDRSDELDFFLIGGGRDPFALPERLRVRFRDVSLSVDAMSTGAAVRTWNILLSENRRVGAALIAVE
ncbi:MAG TPA: MTH938/NDUFAF3 family protein [Pseudolabrys sp.]|nr:MTH938/NDUFAF3 family protein [Pseudolabrys sp.]